MTTSYGVGSSLVDGLFSSSLGSTQNAQLDSFAQNNLVKGLQLYSDQKYNEAIQVFKRAIGYSPKSSAAINAYDYMAKAYINLGDQKSAIEAYQKSIVADPSQDAAHTSLANLYYSQGDYGKALKQYQQAAKLNPSGANYFSLGQGYLADGQYDNALQAFNTVRRQAPTDPYGDFGKGQVYAKQGMYADAISAFQRAIKIDPGYWNAYSEMGYALADTGQLKQAQDIVTNTLQANAPDLATQLSTYIDSKTKPQILGNTYSDIGTPFLTVPGPGTKVSNLGSLNLVNPDTTQTFSISFQFSKPMDQSSVENLTNWTITRASGKYLSDTYNYGQTTPSSEVMLPYNPTGVIYDSKTMIATVLFSVTQNSSANGTIDPSHIQFTFNGTDANGLAMDPKANEYTGFTGVA